MDRTQLVVGILLIAALPATSALSDTVYPAMDAPAQDGGPTEKFPESRFGMPPMRVETGVGQHYASRAVTDMEASDEGDAVPADADHSRSPASLDMSSGHVVRRNFPNPPSRNLGDGSAAAAQGSSDIVYSQSSMSDTLHSEVTRHGVQEVALIASDLGFFPRTVFVSRDVPVRLFVTGASKNTLCIMMDSFQVRKQVRSNKIEEITFTPATPGKFRFYCPVNGMEGTLVVKELSTDPGTEGASRSVARIANMD